MQSTMMARKHKFAAVFATLAMVAELYPTDAAIGRDVGMAMGKQGPGFSALSPKSKAAARKAAKEAGHLFRLKDDSDVLRTNNGINNDPLTSDAGGNANDVGAVPSDVDVDNVGSVDSGDGRGSNGGVVGNDSEQTSEPTFVFQPIDFSIGSTQSSSTGSESAVVSQDLATTTVTDSTTNELTTSMPTSSSVPAADSTTKITSDAMTTSSLPTTSLETTAVQSSTIDTTTRDSDGTSTTSVGGTEAFTNILSSTTPGGGNEPVDGGSTGFENADPSTGTTTDADSSNSVLWFVAVLAVVFVLIVVIVVWRRSTSQPPDDSSDINEKSKLMGSAPASYGASDRSASQRPHISPPSSAVVAWSNALSGLDAEYELLGDSSQDDALYETIDAPCPTESAGNAVMSSLDAPSDMVMSVVHRSQKSKPPLLPPRDYSPSLKRHATGNTRVATPPSTPDSELGRSHPVPDAQALKKKIRTRLPEDWANPSKTQESQPRSMTASEAVMQELFLADLSDDDQTGGSVEPPPRKDVVSFGNFAEEIQKLPAAPGDAQTQIDPPRRATASKFSTFGNFPSEIKEQMDQYPRAYEDDFDDSRYTPGDYCDGSTA